MRSSLDRVSEPMQPDSEASRWDELLACPADGGPLARTAQGYVAADGRRRYPIQDGIPILFEPNEAMRGDVTETVKAFYEETPFPNYDDLDSRDSLAQKARRGIFARVLDESIGHGTAVLEAGCGTGQLSNFLGMHRGRTVVGADLCLNSLRLANAFRERFSIRNVRFLQMNLFRPPFREEAFDVIISNGVLHHTADPERGFRSLVHKLKPSGHIIIGLYNRLGRLPTYWRRAAIRTFGDGMARLDSRLRGLNLNEGRWQAWFRDQYKHPHESTHGYGEVIRWFEAAGVDYVSSIPGIDDTSLRDDENLFAARSKGSVLDRTGTELEMLLRGGVDGGLFIMIGRRRGD
jgi:SAM-dependent methyltransferase